MVSALEKKVKIKIIVILEEEQEEDLIITIITEEDGIIEEAIMGVEVLETIVEDLIAGTTTMVGTAIILRMMALEV